MHERRHTAAAGIRLLVIEEADEMLGRCFVAQVEDIVVSSPPRSACSSLDLAHKVMKSPVLYVSWYILLYILYRSEGPGIGKMPSYSMPHAL
jgi:hypothetical protein